MALTPDDVLNKRFTPTKFREGYDQEEVDEYLDNEILPELKRLNSENERLQSDLDAANQRIAELESGAPAAPAAAATSADTDYSPAAKAPVQEARPETDTGLSSALAPGLADTGEAGEGGDSASSMLALAQRVHDEHVRNGQSTADNLISEARSRADEILGEAQEKSRVTLTNLEEERTLLERKIDGLRTFERDYRNRLKNYLESQLQELDANAPKEQPGTGI